MANDPGERLTTVIALGYAIAALEALPPEWHSVGERDDLSAMKALLGRLMTDRYPAARLIEACHVVLDGRENATELSAITRPLGNDPSPDVERVPEVAKQRVRRVRIAAKG